MISHVAFFLFVVGVSLVADIAIDTLMMLCRVIL